jgi:hypothetical protein
MDGLVVADVRIAIARVVLFMRQEYFEAFRTY